MAILDFASQFWNIHLKVFSYLNIWETYSRVLISIFE